MKPWHVEMTMKLHEGDRLAAVKIIEPRIPVSLYKYMGAGSHSFENFHEEKFFMSYPSQYNDPYDSLFSLIVDEVEEGNLDKIYREDAKFTDDNIINYLIMEDEIREEGSKWRNTIKCCSFSEVKDSILMWSHYAQNHEGVCVEYDFSRVKTRSLENELYPIRYEQNMIRLDLNDDFDNIYIPLIAAIVKSKAWSYEKEWRIVIPSGQGFTDQAGRTFVKTPRAAALYLGAKMTRSLKDEYLSLARARNLNTYSVVVNPRKFRLEFIPEFIAK